MKIPREKKEVRGRDRGIKSYKSFFFSKQEIGMVLQRCRLEG